MCYKNNPQIPKSNAPIVEVELLTTKQIRKPLPRNNKYSTCLKKKPKKQKNFRKVKILTKTYSKIIDVPKKNPKKNENTSRKRKVSCEPIHKQTICKKKPKIQTKGGIVLSKSRKVREKLTLEEKKKRKMERNRTNAKRFRERRKIFVQQLEQETNHLKSENQNLNLKLNEISQENLLLRQQIEQLKKIHPTIQRSNNSVDVKKQPRQTTKQKVQIGQIEQIEQTKQKEQKEQIEQKEQTKQIEQIEQIDKIDETHEIEQFVEKEKNQEDEYFDQKKQIEFLNLEFEKNFKNNYSNMNDYSSFEKGLNWNLSKKNSHLELQEEKILDIRGVFDDCGFENIEKKISYSNNMIHFENPNNDPLFNPSVWGENFN
ncbi:basic-leucine zipper transcription factor f-related [Anaeramoeba flamelloides]|uniref:Basic-leucine zipper transcription factor f-related n=1 Tax=Anaeramoeba flamelloides TaxID=1746091 RepID=A0ABQ8Y9R2_9EUKA|nr:basic-leucine zipper transcription factor f-related [Anaeramoeba flamelloides]